MHPLVLSMSVKETRRQMKKYKQPTSHSKVRVVLNLTVRYYELLPVS